MAIGCRRRRSCDTHSCKPLLLLLDLLARVGEKVHQGFFWGRQEVVSGLLASAKPYRIKASHRRRRKCAWGQSVQRYYDPGVGRFLSVDPVTADGGDMRFFNRYAYAFNSPYKFTDPDGRCPSCVGALIGGGLELGFQLFTADGRASYAAAGAALANGDFRGAVSAAGANVAKVAASAAAGAVGAGLAGKIAQGANLISKGIEGSSAAANVAANVGIKVAGNSAVGAGLGATTQGVSCRIPHDHKAVC